MICQRLPALGDLLSDYICMMMRTCAHRFSWECIEIKLRFHLQGCFTLRYCEKSMLDFLWHQHTHCTRQDEMREQRRRRQRRRKLSWMKKLGSFPKQIESWLTSFPFPFASLPFFAFIGSTNPSIKLHDVVLLSQHISCPFTKCCSFCGANNL